MASESDNQPIDLSTKIKLLDGDIRSQINRYVGKFPDRAPLYQYNRYKKIIYNVHIDFLNSGSNLIRTNTYYALFPYLKRSPVRLSHYAYIETIECAVQIAQESIRDYCSNNNIYESSLSIVGSCGCFDNKAINSLQPYELRDAHRERIRILNQKGIKILSLEGIRSFEEAKMLLDIVMLENSDMKTLVMFDGSKDLPSLMNYIPKIYTKYGSQITAIGLDNIYDVRTRELCELIIQQNTENLIPLVMCTKRDGESWNSINVKNDAPVREWHKFGIRYIGGGKHVVSEDIKSLRVKLNST